MPYCLDETLERSGSQAERAGKIISRIREFVKRSEPRRQQVSVMRIVENAVGFADIDARKRQVEIQLDLPEFIPDVLADPILIEQVLLNLLKNGVEAMESSDYRTLHLVITHQSPRIAIAG